MWKDIAQRGIRYTHLDRTVYGLFRSHHADLVRQLFPDSGKTRACLFASASMHKATLSQRSPRTEEDIVGNQALSTHKDSHINKALIKVVPPTNNTD